MINRNNGIASIVQDSNKKLFLAVGTSNGYLMELVPIPLSFISQNDTNKVERSDKFNLWMRETIEHSADKFWDKWERNNLKGDIPIKMFGSWYAGTNAEKNTIICTIISICFVILLNFFNFQWSKSLIQAITCIQSLFIIYHLLSRLIRKSIRI